MSGIVAFGKDKGHIDFDKKARETQKDMNIAPPVFNHEFL